MSNSPKLFFRIADGDEIVYSTSQKGLAEKAQKYNNIYSKSKEYNHGYIKPRREGEGVTQETRNCVNYIDTLVQQYMEETLKRNDMKPDVQNLTAAIIFSSLKFFGDSSHLANGEEIEDALKYVTEQADAAAAAARQNMVYYLVQEKPYFCRLLIAINQQ